jgi:hypothetical protein
MDLKRAFDEANKRLRLLNDQMCCLTAVAGGGTYNSTTTQSLLAGDVVVLPATTFHSISWDLASGAGITINNGVTTPTTYYSNGSIEFSTLNAQSLTITAVTGAVRLITVY